MKKIVLFLPVLFAAIILASCSSPDACFIVNTEWDSIHVNQPVIFNAECSSRSGEVVWEFQGPRDSTIYYDRVITKTFADTGNFHVELVVVRGNKTGSAGKSFYVHP